MIKFDQMLPRYSPNPQTTIPLTVMSSRDPMILAASTTTPTGCAFLLHPSRCFGLTQSQQLTQGVGMLLLGLAIVFCPCFCGLCLYCTYDRSQAGNVNMGSTNGAASSTNWRGEDYDDREPLVKTAPVPTFGKNNPHIPPVAVPVTSATHTVPPIAVPVAVQVAAHAVVVTGTMGDHLG